MHRMGVMAMLVNDPSIDRERYYTLESSIDCTLTLSSTRCIKMAIVHDLAEAVVVRETFHFKLEIDLLINTFFFFFFQGDITPHAGVSKEDKFTMEKVLQHFIHLQHTH